MNQTVGLPVKCVASPHLDLESWKVLVVFQFEALIFNDSACPLEAPGAIHVIWSVSRHLTTAMSRSYL